MTLTSEEMRLIREALLHYVERCFVGPSRLPMADKLLRCDFPHIPDATKKVLSSVTVLTPTSKDMDDGQPDVRITPHNGGYLIECRRRAPYKFYPVEWFEDWTFTQIMVAKLSEDASFRREAIRDAKGAEFYMEKSKRVPRQKRERAETPGPMFDFNGNPLE